MNNFEYVTSSFRDSSSGRVLKMDDRIYRVVYGGYKDNYDMLMGSGLYEELVEKKMLIPHREIKDRKLHPAGDIYKLLMPDIVPFISYPYEWGPEMYFKAAMLTLQIQETAVRYGMTLKDASAFNVQFIGSHPVFIDTLSFEIGQKESPWIAYRQFCRHFLAPLSLMKFRDLQLGRLMSQYMDGIPLELAVNILPGTAYLNIHLLIHLFLHNFGSRKLEGRNKVGNSASFNMRNLISSLKSGVLACRLKIRNSDWLNYYLESNYTKEALEEKKSVVGKILNELNPDKLADLGSNTGLFSRIAAKTCRYVISADIDPSSVNENYIQAYKEKTDNLLSLCIDLNNPSPGIGWENNERFSFLHRLRVNAVMALALVHHLYFSNNLSFAQIAGLFATLGDFLIVEFIPPGDSQIKSLIGLRKDDFSGFNVEEFEREFGKLFDIKQKYGMKGTQRIIYLMKKKNVK